MRHVFILLVTVGLAFQAAAQTSATSTVGASAISTVGASAISVPQAAPIKKVKITDLQDYISHCDHPLIVSFWATFCVPCVKEIPYFESTVARYQSKKVELILVSLDLPSYYPGRINEFVKKSNFRSSIWWLNETDADYFCPKVDARWSGGIPCSLFINNTTHYRRFFDRQLTEPQVEQEVKALVAQP